MSELGVFAYCAAVGFATSAAISTFYQWVTSEAADFLIGRTTPVGIVVSVLLSMFAGPFIVMRKVVAGLRSKQLNALPAVLGTIVAGMWSVCAGIFYISLVISA